MDSENNEPTAPETILITPLLKRLWPEPAHNNVTADEIAFAVSHIFTDQLSPVQTGALLTCLHFTGWDRRADIIAKCAATMREAASRIDRVALEEVIKAQGRPEGGYQGGLVSLSSRLARDVLISRSATLLVRVVIRITRSTFPPPRPSWPLRYSS